MKFKEIENKELYLKEHYIFSPLPALTDKRHCIHCDQDFIVGDFKVQLEYNNYTKRIEEYIVCPNAPKCDGTLIDWVRVDE
jgi:hypothetical protein